MEIGIVADDGRGTFDGGIVDAAAAHIGQGFAAQFFACGSEWNLTLLIKLPGVRKSRHRPVD